MKLVRAQVKKKIQVTTRSFQILWIEINMKMFRGSLPSKDDGGCWKVASATSK